MYERDGSTIVKINNHVYTAGGLRSNFVECLDLNQVDGDWYKLASMNEQRQFAASAVLNGCFFIFNNLLVVYYCRKMFGFLLTPATVYIYLGWFNLHTGKSEPLRLYLLPNMFLISNQTQKVLIYVSY